MWRVLKDTKQEKIQPRKLNTNLISYRIITFEIVSYFVCVKYFKNSITYNLIHKYQFIKKIEINKLNLKH